MNVPSRTARQQRIIDLITREEVRTQSALRSLLIAAGYEVTQATLSRDLDEIGAVKIQSQNGHSIYAVSQPGDPTRTPQPLLDSDAQSRLSKVANEVVTGVEAAMNIVVIHTKAGAAHYFGGAIDRNVWADVVGSVAGDDTVMVVTPSVESAKRVQDLLLLLSSQNR
ncbi:MAG: arginine repressor [Actinobacteria bacterium]|nr:arginine repressor [Actinomycetota bacterium]